MRKQRANILSIGLVLICASALFLVSCTPTGSQVSGSKGESTVYDRVLKSGKIRAAYITYPPAVIKETTSGRLSGTFVETLEEIAMENRKVFLQAGGERYEYIPCLNDSEAHIQMLTKLAQRYLGGWEND